MFATGLPQIGEAYFTASSMMIGLTAGTIIFCWLATMWSGRLQMTAAMHFVFGFLFIFIMGGMTGMMLASIPLDLQVHDTYFVVAHFHYVLIGGTLFPLFGGFHYWFPKFTGRLIDERLGKVTFWILFTGFNLTFFPLHMAGIQGMPRRIYTYAVEMGWESTNLVATLGAFLIGVGGLVFLMNVVRSRQNGPLAGPNPWDASTLEWAADSPPANYNFVHLLLVSSRSPLWADPSKRGFVVGLRDDRREVLVTTHQEAQPHHRAVLPGSSVWPLLTALGIGIGLAISIFTFNGYYVASLLGTAGFIGWFWPRPPLEVNA
jgi:cytochrome c oxidase subunit 1